MFTTVMAASTPGAWSSFLSLLFSGAGLTLLAIFLAITLPGIGSAKGVGMVGQAGAGLLTEEPNMFGKVLILQALPMTQGIYGFIAAFWIMINAGFINGNIYDLTAADGVYYLISSLPIAIVGWISAIHQARVACSGVLLIGKQKDKVVPAMTSAAMVETYAIFALLISLLLIIFKG